MATPKSSFPPPWYRLESPSNHPFIAIPSNSDLPIYLTTLHESDAPAVQAAVSHPLVSNHLVSVPYPYTLTDAHSWISLQLSGKCCLPMQALRAGDPQSGHLIGCVSLTPQPSPGRKEKLEYELAYYLHPDWQGKGIIKNAVLALLSWAIEEKGIRDVFVRVVETNAKSRSVVSSIPEFKVEKEGVEIKWPESKGGDVKLLTVWRLDLGDA